MTNSSNLPIAFLVRHGETAWSRTGQHTGRTDLALTPQGEATSRQLAERLQGFQFVKVFSSPLQRAWRTCELAGFGEVALKDPDLMEWDYGQYEGMRTSEIKALAPDWDLCLDGCPNGETLADVVARVDRVIARIREQQGPVLVFSSGHLLRVLAARWCGLDGLIARHLLISTCSISVLGYDHADLREPAIQSWNLTS